MLVCSISFIMIMINKVQIVYFSPAHSTREIVRRFANSIKLPTEEINITVHPTFSISSSPDCLLVVGVPVYAGRVPAIAMERLSQVRGSKNPAVAICVYGNREYDDALLELSDILSENNFEVIAASAMIARHSIFPNVAQNRPNEKDYSQLEDFAHQICKKIKESKEANLLIIPGNRPYREPKSVPLDIHTSNECDNCGTCVKQCPTQAINPNQPKITNNEICIRCTRCIIVCPQKAKKFTGIKYKLANNVFTSKNNKVQKENAFFI